MEARGRDAYLYHFTRVPPVSLPGFPEGAFHGLEVPYVFGETAVFGVRDPIDVRLSEQMMRMWTAFAATGDPNGAGGERWPAYRRATDRHLEFGDTLAVRSGLHRRACDLADEIRMSAAPAQP